MDTQPAEIFLRRRKQGIIPARGAFMAWEKILGGRGASVPLKEVASGESDSASSSGESSAVDPKRDARRSKRVYIAMPVIVKGQQGAETFEEKASTESVSAHGCLIRLAKVVNRGQKLTLTNVKSREAVECRVAYIGQSEGGKIQAGIEFSRPAGYFWHIAFPPDDWNAVERKRPAPEAGSIGRHQ
ncbi:MAG TPA: PilZ domain-containing protein [Candidatus Angelobacter sp.]|nr:PilZ domain-containing protein [Candidatus Angelobacter sp.]